jgi:hypothetical protein
MNVPPFGSLVPFDLLQQVLTEAFGGIHSSLNLIGRISLLPKLAALRLHAGFPIFEGAPGLALAGGGVNVRFSESKDFGEHSRTLQAGPKYIEHW